MQTTISLLKIMEDTCVDGPGFRTAIYCAGCPNACPGCHNPHSWDIDHGTPTRVDDILRKVMEDDFADVTFTGGDPMFQAQEFACLAEAIKASSNKNIWCYTGFIFETLLNNPSQRRLLNAIDVLVDGPFVEALKDADLPFRGSSNQRIIDVQESLRTNTTVLFDLGL